MIETSNECCYNGRSSYSIANYCNDNNNRLRKKTLKLILIMSHSFYLHDLFVSLNSLNGKKILCAGVDYCSAYISLPKWKPIKITNPVHFFVYFLELELVGWVCTTMSTILENILLNIQYVLVQRKTGIFIWYFRTSFIINKNVSTCDFLVSVSFN